MKSALYNMINIDRFVKYSLPWLYIFVSTTFIYYLTILAI